MNFISQFICTNGYTKYREIVNYVEENELLDEYETVHNSTQDLFYFTIKYGQCCRI